MIEQILDYIFGYLFVCLQVFVASMPWLILVDNHNTFVLGALTLLIFKLCKITT